MGRGLLVFLWLLSASAVEHDVQCNVWQYDGSPHERGHKAIQHSPTELSLLDRACRRGGRRATLAHARQHHFRERPAQAGGHVRPQRGVQPDRVDVGVVGREVVQHGLA